VTVPVTFAPVASGTDDASLVVTSSDGSVSTVSLTGSGADAPGAPVASSPQLDFGVLGVGGAPASLDADFTNNGTDPVVVTGTLSPGAPFSVPSPPAVGEVIAPGAALDLPLSFAPPGTSGAWAGTVTLLTDHGAVSVSVAGATDVGGPAASFSSDNIALGAVDETGRPERTLAVTDTGTTDLVVTGWPAGPDQGFAAASAGGGITVFPGQTVEETITFTPPAVGNFATNWHLTANDGTTVNLTLSAIVVPAGTVPDPALGGWQLNGTARQNGPVLDLTEVGQFGAAGSAFWPTPVDSAGLDVTFTSTIGGGGGADGLTLTFADPASAGPGSLGGFGGGLGYAGVAGVAVALDTYPFDQVAVADGSSQGLPTWVASTTNVPDLHQGTHQVEVQVTPGEVTVRLDGSVVLTAAVSLPRQVLLGFTGGSGGFDDEHGVSGVDILTDAGAVPPGLPEVPWAPILLVVPAGALLLAARRQVRPRRGRQPRGQ
jgi:hypothetical protein